MGVGLLLSFITGWLVGALGNWMADQLPHWPQRQLHFGRHQYFASLLPWRMETTAGEPRSWRRTLLAAAMAVAFVVGWLRFGDNMVQLIVAWLYTLWLLVVFVIDFEHRRVLNLMLPPAVGVALLAAVLGLSGIASLPNVTSVLLGGLAGFGSFLAVYIIGRGRMMGAGDVKLAGVIGLMVGYPLVWAALATGIFLGGIAAIFLIVRCRAAAKSYMAYGPYLAAGALAVFWIYWP
jgi:prepilin signal peptidase PulO-like enzyme (type II secretory pathway)